MKLEAKGVKFSVEAKKEKLALKNEIQIQKIVDANCEVNVCDETKLKLLIRYDHEDGTEPMTEKDIEVLIRKQNAIFFSTDHLKVVKILKRKSSNVKKLIIEMEAKWRPKCMKS